MYDVKRFNYDDSVLEDELKDLKTITNNEKYKDFITNMNS